MKMLYLHTLTARYILPILISMMVVLPVQAQSTQEIYQAYIDKYKNIAFDLQKRYRIPASIILAQGLLESGAGRGTLARNANNHFGIKCHNWSGATIYHDDDERNECFRKYRDAEESFVDYAIFLTTRPRYSQLFELNPHDYVGWATGLRAAGYATDPAYPQKLISLIERYNLQQYSQLRDLKPAHVADNGRIVQSGALTVYKSNYKKIVVSRPGDTWESLAKELRIRERRLRSYNDVGETTPLRANQIVYLSRKNSKASRANQIHVVQDGESMYSISQLYGIRLVSLYELNNMGFEQGARVGQIIQLR